MFFWNLKKTKNSYSRTLTKGACILLSIYISFARALSSKPAASSSCFRTMVDGRTDGQTFDRFIDLTPHTVPSVSLMSTPIQTVIVVYLLCFVISGGCFEKEMNSCTDTDLIVAVSYWFFFLDWVLLSVIRSNMWTECCCKGYRAFKDAFILLNYLWCSFWIGVCTRSIYIYCWGCKHRRSRPTGPVGRVPSNFGDNGDQVYSVPSNFCNWLSFFCWALWEA